MKIPRFLSFLFLSCVLGAAIGHAREAVREAIPNWPAPPFWSPTEGVRAGREGAHPLLVQGIIPGAFPFIPITPCRQYDSRTTSPLPDNTNRTILLSGPPCGIPSTAAAVSVNITVFNITGAPSNGVFRVGVAADPPTSWINYPPTETQRANAGVVPTDGSGNIIVKLNQGAGSVDFIVDVNGYYGELFADSTNVFVGPGAGTSTTLGDGNTGFGYLALNGNIRGIQNTAIGDGALQNNVSSANTASGYHALQNNIGGVNNTAVGAEALQNRTSAQDNTAVGSGALAVGATGNGNTAIGIAALQNNTGDGNIALGYSAGFFLTTGQSNIDIGHPGVAGESNVTRIGQEAFTSRTFIAGITGATVTGIPVLVSTAGQLGVASSSRCVKEDIREVAEESNGLMNLRPVAFRYKPEIDPTGLTQYGLIAEEVAEVYPDLVALDRDGKPQTVRYHLINALLLNEVQKQHQTIQEQGQQIARLTKERDEQISSQRAQISGLEARLAALATQAHRKDSTDRE